MMFLFKKKSLKDEKEKIGNDILKWSTGNEHFLNVISAPYNSSEIFMKVILYYVERNKKVIYITNEDHDDVNIMDGIKKCTDFRDYAYIKSIKTNINCRLRICNFNNAIQLKEKFDLVIYDDIRSFPSYGNYEVLNLISKMSNESTKLIVYSIENILKNNRELVLPVKDNRIPIIEPRTILTRIDINKDIPFVIYDYLRWSINSDRKVIICVPDEDKLEKVYFYISNYCRNISKSIVCFTKGKTDKRLIANFQKMKKVVIITNDFEKVFSNSVNVDVMVYFADDSRFDYKKLIYFCGSVGRSEKDSKGEVIFLANEETEDMEKAKNITRNFNKEAWEMGLLKI
jgi:late competence protein required for DNA uptake (superfamily II DNA/RNA helicase)